MSISLLSVGQSPSSRRAVTSCHDSPPTSSSALDSGCRSSHILPVDDFSDCLLQVLEGQRVLPKKAQELGFTYKYRFISDALKASFSA
jgi:hypothetical protein